MKHIPVSDTRETPVLTFAEALAPTNNTYDRNAWLYIPDHYDEYRYILGTRGENPLICIGVNPSTAIPGALDPTLKSAQRIALHNGYDSFIMFNVYAQRATVPDDMDREMNTLLHAENMNAFRFVLERAGEYPSIWAAWGAVIEKRPWLPLCVQDMIAIGRTYEARWFTAGPRSKAGHPHHPLYLRKDTPLEPFTDLTDYLRHLTKA